jgi:outer membrane protein assembly factor BamB
MASAQVPVRRRGFFRFWVPWIILTLAGGILIFLWVFPTEEIDRGSQTMFSIMTGLLTSVLLLAWFVFFSGLGWPVRLGVLFLVMLAAGAVAGSIRRISFTGDMQPNVETRWARSRDDILEESRKKVTGELPPIVLDAGKATDYAEYRGRKRDAIVAGPALNTDWKANPPKLLWKQPCGGGYSGFAVAGNVAITIEQRRDKEAVVCYDIGTGKERWVYTYPGDFSEPLGGEGPRATPTIIGDDVYSLGALGHLACLDGKTGQKKWAVEILKDNENAMWAMSGSPLVYDNVVVVNPGAQRTSAKGRALVAYDRATGKEAWTGGDTRAGYSSPMLATLAGKRQIVLLDGEGVGGYDPTTGKRLWWYTWTVMNGINVAQPVILAEDRVFISTAYNVGCAMLKISNDQDKWSVKEEWKNKQMRCKFTSPVTSEGYIYGLDEGILSCLDPKTRKQTWRDGRYGHGQLLLTNGILVILSEAGKLALVEANPKAYHELASMPAIEAEKTWNCPALANGKALVRNHHEMACYDLKGSSAAIALGTDAARP